MKTCLNYIAYLTVRGLFLLLGLLSQRARVALFGGVFRLVFLLVPRVRATILTNLALAFPDKDEQWRRSLMRGNATEMGRLLADTIRLASLDAPWVEQHVDIPILNRYIAAHAGGKGVLVATGHLGSFELLGHAIGLVGHPLAAIARRFKSPQLDSWWTKLREARGNRIIDRTGAFKEMVRTIESGTSVAMLFDQNVKINHAVFVDWFGTSAATTRAFALAVVKTRAPVFVASIRYVGDDHYVVDANECDFSSVLDDTCVSDEERIEIITAEISRRYCEMIRAFPEGWFWLHRRWKTRPEGELEKVYR
jgi:KDO2-lipid IV(A) lauroyltransferase